MQKDISTVHGGDDSILSDSLNYTSLYSSFSPYPSASNSPPSSTTGYHTTTTTSISSKTNPRGLEFPFSPSPHSLLVQEQQDLVNSHSLCLAHLYEATKEAEALSRENTTLRVANRDLNERLNLVTQTPLQKRSMTSDYMTLQSPIVNGISGLCIGDKRNGTDSGVWPGGHHQSFVESPTSVMDPRSYLVVNKNDGVERVSLPKSISVRSNEYLKTSQGVWNVNHGGRTRSLNRPRTASPPNATRRVYVCGGKKEGAAVELETYNQGMLKTEICNKWQETGACPYGDHCQFAHGIEELRPVIRHPRYKTEICRLVLAGGPCPYGHRCHFRHALTDQEKLIAAYNPRALKLNR